MFRRCRDIFVVFSTFIDRISTTKALSCCYFCISQSFITIKLILHETQTHIAEIYDGPQHQNDVPQYYTEWFGCRFER